MKDLIKGHHPLMLFFVALVSLFFAFAVRNKIIGEGHTDLNANFFFFMVLASCIGIYFLIHEVIKEFTDFFCKKSLKKREIVPQPSLTTCVELKDVPSNESQDKAEPKNGNPPLTREDAKMLFAEILAIKTDNAVCNQQDYSMDNIKQNILDLSNVASNALMK